MHKKCRESQSPCILYLAFCMVGFHSPLLAMKAAFMACGLFCCDLVVPVVVPIIIIPVIIVIAFTDVTNGIFFDNLL